MFKTTVYFANFNYHAQCHVLTEIALICRALNYVAIECIKIRDPYFNHVYSATVLPVMLVLSFDVPWLFVLRLQPTHFPNPAIVTPCMFHQISRQTCSIFVES